MIDPRERLLRDIEREARLTAAYTGRAAFRPAVLAALAGVERAAFVGPHLQALAYVNGPLAIGHGQTISQPFIVALMTDLLEPEPGHTILEIGTGSGYQAAVLASLVKQVYSVEILAPLARAAAERLARLGYANVATRLGDGYAGWPEHAPYDGILVTAAAPHVPAPLVAQLKPGAPLVIPVGEPYGSQELLVVTKPATGAVRTRSVLPVAFVPLTGALGSTTD